MRKIFPVLKRRRAWIDESRSIDEEVYNALLSQREENPLAVSFFQDIMIPKVEPVQYIQGQDKCPICGGVVNYTYSKFSGFTVYECSMNDCLPWPVGGAKKRREAGLPQLIPTRYQKAEK